MTLSYPLGAEENDLQFRFPSRPTEIFISHARLPTSGQKIDRPIDVLTEARCRRVMSSSGAETPLSAPPWTAADAASRTWCTWSPNSTCGICLSWLQERLHPHTPGGPPAVVNDKPPRATREMPSNPEISIEIIAAPPRVPAHLEGNSR